MLIAHTRHFVMFHNFSIKTRHFKRKFVFFWWGDLGRWGVSPPHTTPAPEPSGYAPVSPRIQATFTSTVTLTFMPPLSTQCIGQLTSRLMYPTLTSRKARTQLLPPTLLYCITCQSCTVSHLYYTVTVKSKQLHNTNLFHTSWRLTGHSWPTPHRQCIC